jgi:CheY-like chemotaxis protein
VHVAADMIAAGYLVLPSAPISSSATSTCAGRLRFVAALKADATLPPIPVIFLTSYNEGDDRGKELGAVGYITKPVRADKLLQLVAKHVPGGALPIG